MGGGVRVEVLGKGVVVKGAKEIEHVQVSKMNASTKKTDYKSEINFTFSHTK